MSMEATNIPRKNQPVCVFELCCCLFKTKLLNKSESILSPETQHRLAVTLHFNFNFGHQFVTQWKVNKNKNEYRGSVALLFD